MQTKFSYKLLWLLFFFAEFCCCDDQYSLVVKMNDNICTMLIYIDNQGNISDNQDIIAKTCFNFIEDDFLAEDIINKNEIITSIGIKNLKNQLLEKHMINSIYLESIVIGFFENNNYNKQNLPQKKSQQQTDFTRKLHYYLDINAFNHDITNIVIIDNHELLIQLASEYLYRNQNIYIKFINRFLVSSFNNHPKNIEIITNKNNKIPTNFIMHDTPINLNNYKNIFYILTTNDTITLNYRQKNKDKLILINTHFPSYNIYQLAKINNIETFFVYRSENLIYTNILDDSNNFKNNYLQQIIKISKDNIYCIHSITGKSKLDYTIVIDELLTNDTFYNIYLQNLKTNINLNQNNIYVVSKEDFYVCLIAAAKTIAKQFKQKPQSDFTSIYSKNLAETKKYPVVNKPIANRINSMFNTADDIQESYTLSMIDEQLASNQINKLDREWQLPSPKFLDPTDNLFIETNDQIYFNAGFIDEDTR